MDGDHNLSCNTPLQTSTSKSVRVSESAAGNSHVYLSRTKPNLGLTVWRMLRQELVRVQVQAWKDGGNAALCCTKVPR